MIGKLVINWWLQPTEMYIYLNALKGSEALRPSWKLLIVPYSSFMEMSHFSHLGTVPTLSWLSYTGFCRQEVSPFGHLGIAPKVSYLGFLWTCFGKIAFVQKPFNIFTFCKMIMKVKNIQCLTDVYLYIYNDFKILSTCFFKNIVLKTM